MRGPPWKSLGMCRRVTNKGESGFGKASDRVKAKDHRPSGILGEVWWGALSREGRKLDRCSKVIIGFPVSIPGALIKRRGPDPPLSPCRINTKSKHHFYGTNKSRWLGALLAVAQSSNRHLSSNERQAHGKGARADSLWGGCECIPLL